MSPAENLVLIWLVAGSIIAAVWVLAARHNKRPR